MGSELCFTISLYAMPLDPLKFVMSDLAMVLVALRQLS